MRDGLADEPGAVLWLGPTGRDRVLLLHDLAASGSTSWLGQLSLADEVNLGVVDRPGYAMTDPVSAAGWTADTTMLVGLLDRDGPCHLVAHGNATAGALMAAQLAPSLVRSLVLVEPPLFQLAQGSSLVEDLSGALVELHRHAEDLTGAEYLKEYLLTVGYLEPPRLSVPQRCAEAARAERPACQAPIDLDTLARTSVSVTVVVGGRQGGWHDPGERTVFGGAVWRTAEVLAGAMDGWLVPIDSAGHEVQRRTGAFNQVLCQHLEAWWGSHQHGHVAAGT
ncbi:pimeloyl-ACP methyl ester carboxylesterase [Kutzneria viridogrisea]|uniref:Pimeloyl-ACP methyl ester carboxylesterase n=1 Tax=Kutzneria viridogrisea TaxID=47990 RepID=A0ABR6BS48_9PSEU|nr:pimeloyl-ACP methyl ester carboxylesterase [Kutzneria viridogrisea]